MKLEKNNEKCPNCRSRMELLLINGYPKSIVCNNCGYISQLPNRVK